jgi:hypothetical protein
MVAGVYITVKSSSCPVPPEEQDNWNYMWWFTVVMYASYFLLFAKMYVEKYHMAKKSPVQASNKAALSVRYAVLY